MKYYNVIFSLHENIPRFFLVIVSYKKASSYVISIKIKFAAKNLHLNLVHKDYGQKQN